MMRYNVQIIGDLLEVSAVKFGRQVGYLQLMITDAIAEIRFFDVHVDYRKRGYAKSMICKAIERLKEETNVKEISVFPHPEDILSDELMAVEDLYIVYEKLGFVFCNVNPNIHKINQKMCKKI